MKKIFTFFLVLCFTATAAIALENSNFATSIPAYEIKNMMEDGANFKLIDARGGKQFREEHIKGAVNIPANEANSETFAEIAPDMGTKLVFYCSGNSGNASNIAAQKAIGAGYKYVYRYRGGIEEWKKLGYSTEVSAK